MSKSIIHIGTAGICQSKINELERWTSSYSKLTKIGVLHGYH